MPSNKRAGGFSIIEVLIVLAVTVVLAAIAFPQIISSRRLLRFNGLAREITSQLRFARQQAMSQRQVFRFRYDNVNKQIVIFDNQERGTDANPIANNTNDDVIVRTISLTSTGVAAGDIVYNRPAGAPNSLPDGTTRTGLSSNQVEVIFQPDGSVLDANGDPLSTAMFFYNNKASDATAFAVSVLGAGGRVKLWRYNKNDNLYVE